MSKANPETPERKTQWSSARAPGTEENIYQNSVQRGAQSLPRETLCSGWGLEGISSNKIF